MRYFYIIQKQVAHRIYLTRLLVAKTRDSHYDPHNVAKETASALRDILDISVHSVTAEDNWNFGDVKAFKRVLTVHPDYDTITEQLAERVPGVRDHIVKLGYPALPLQDGALSFSYANFLTARKAFKYSKKPIWYGSGRVIGIERRGANPVAIPIRYEVDH